MSTDDIKQKVGTLAANLVQNHMIVGLGTGSTASYFIKRLGERRKEGLEIQAVATSIKSEALARKEGIPLIDIESITAIDLTIDGADEIDKNKQMIKGAGGALLREKIIATMSKELIIVVDESKLSERLGRAKLPVEIVPFAHHFIQSRLEKMGFHGTLRTAQDGKLFITDNGNLILDINLDRHVNPRKEHEALIHVPGVVETGFFFDLAGRVIVGYRDGRVQIKE